MKINILIAFLLLAQFSYAWNWDTHQKIASSVYYSLPEEIKSKLNIDIIKEGAIIPDKKFKDFTYHSYPKSYEKASMFLQKALENYNSNQFDEASLNIGIATHYISDSFSSPHNIKKENFKDHSKYEEQASKLDPAMTDCIDSEENMNEIMSKGQLTGNDWQAWLDTQGHHIPKKHLGKAYTAATQIVLNSFNAKCNILNTKYENLVYNSKLLPISIIIILIMLLASSLWIDFRSTKKF